MVYKQTKINITKAQLNKALNGKPIKISKDQIGSGSVYLSLHPANRKIVERASIKGSGCCLNLSEGELLSSAEDMGGEGIFGDIWKGLKSGYKWAKKNVIDTPFYQEAIKPVVRGLVQKGLQVAKTAAPGELGKAIDMGSDLIGKETGAFGIKGKKGCCRTKAQRKALLQAKGLYLS